MEFIPFNNNKSKEEEYTQVCQHFTCYFLFSWWNKLRFLHLKTDLAFWTSLRHPFVQIHSNKLKNILFQWIHSTTRVWHYLTAIPVKSCGTKEKHHTIFAPQSIMLHWCNRQTHFKMYLGCGLTHVNHSQTVPRVWFGIQNHSQSTLEAMHFHSFYAGI